MLGYVIILEGLTRTAVIGGSVAAGCLLFLILVAILLHLIMGRRRKLTFLLRYFSLYLVMSGIAGIERGIDI